LDRLHIDRDYQPVFAAFVAAANRLNLAYIHVIDMALAELNTLAMVKANWSGAIIANNNLKADSAATLLNQGKADAVSFGRAFIANPDLPARIRAGAVLAKPDYDHLYTGEAKGYSNYPKL
jgi:N-ethylmaleimide reductase